MYVVEVRNCFSNLEVENRDPEELWQKIREAVLGAAEQHASESQKEKNQANGFLQRQFRLQKKEGWQKAEGIRR